MSPRDFIITISIVAAQITAQCPGRQSLTFARWSGVTADRVPPVFVYTASNEEDSLVGVCLARCRELPDCAGVVVTFEKGNCLGLAATDDTQLRMDSDAAYFKKTCLEVSEECSQRWWSIETTPGYNLHTDSSNLKVILNSTILECYSTVISGSQKSTYRSAQWVGLSGNSDPEMIHIPNGSLGNCVLNVEDKFTEPESYRVSNYFTFYIENQCRHDYPQKIDRCSYEEYYNQTLRHVDFTYKNLTRDEGDWRQILDTEGENTLCTDSGHNYVIKCKTACEIELRFICRGFTWTEAAQGRGLCDLHSEDLVTAGSWLLRRTTPAVYYRRVTCLNITVDCTEDTVIVTYRPHGRFRGRVYVPGRGDACSSRALGDSVKLRLPLYGDCDVNFAYAISKTPAGIVNRTMAYVMVMIQNNPIIQTAGDRWVRVGCSPNSGRPSVVDAVVAVNEAGRPSLPSDLPTATPASASAVYSSSSAPLTMYVVRASDVSNGAVALGEPLELRIETTDAAEIEAYHLVASSRLGDSSVLLLDNKGCATGQVDFPSFTRSYLGGTQRLTARFKAFRFPNSHVVRFAIMTRFCNNKCPEVNCTSSQNRSARDTNDTYSISEDLPASIEPYYLYDKSDVQLSSGVVAQGGRAGCGERGGRVPLELEMVVGARDVLSADTLVRADHRSNAPEDSYTSDHAVVCVHELVLVALALGWLAVQLLLLLGCCVLVKRYRNLAEMNMQKDYHSFDNVGFETISTHRRVHWPDQNVDILHT